ncbi:hypothetical protein NURINAE_00822 [Candidatus Nitrosacidococcus sp. I8]|nr:hypothetical protein NURINAE_00822 [Candidatus Nitrosacidococcus sp. I8]
MVFTYGLAQNSTLEQHYEKLVHMYGDQVHKNAVAVLHNRYIQENINIIIENITSERRSREIISGHITLFIALLPTFLIYAGLIYKDIRENSISKKLLFLASALSPLILYPLGYDFFRWWALALTNLFLVTGIIASIDNQFRDLLISFFYQNQYLALIVIAFCLIKGALIHSMY